MDSGDWIVFRKTLERRIESLAGKLQKAKDTLEALDEVFRDGDLAPSKPNASEPTAATPAAEAATKRTPALPAPASDPSVKPTRIDLVEDLLRQKGGKLTMVEIVDHLDRIGNKRQSMTRSQFYNVVDSSMRSGADRGRFRRTGRRGEWELVPEPARPKPA